GRHLLHPVLRARDVQPAPPQAAGPRTLGGRGGRADGALREERAGYCGGPIMSELTVIERLAPSRNGDGAHHRPAPQAPVRKVAGRRVRALSAFALVALAGALVAGTMPRLKQQRQVEAEAAEAASSAPRVAVAVAREAAPQAERVLPGSSQPLLEAALYPRATGYIKRRLVDIGDRVEEGQLLAEIAAPDLDDQLAQAKANL